MGSSSSNDVGVSVRVDIPCGKTNLTRISNPSSLLHSLANFPAIISTAKMYTPPWLCASSTLLSSIAFPCALNGSVPESAAGKMSK